MGLVGAEFQVVFDLPPGVYQVRALPAEFPGFGLLLRFDYAFLFMPCFLYTGCGMGVLGLLALDCVFVPDECVDCLGLGSRLVRRFCFDIFDV